LFLISLSSSHHSLVCTQPFKRKYSDRLFSKKCFKRDTMVPRLMSMPLPWCCGLYLSQDKKPDLADLTLITQTRQMYSGKKLLSGFGFHKNDVTAIQVALQVRSPSSSFPSS